MLPIVKIMGWPFTIIYILVILVVLYFILVSIPKAIETQNWSSTTATITSNALKKATHTNREHERVTVLSVDIEYAYEVNGQTYTSSVSKLAERDNNGQALHEHLLQQYPVGNSLTVFYNPEKPQESTLQKGLPESYSYICLTLLACLAIMTYVWLSKR